MDRCTGRHCRPVLQLPTGQFCSLQTAGPNKLLALTDDPGAYGMTDGKQTKRTGRGQSKLERGQMMRAVGMAGKEWTGTQPAVQGTAGKHSRRTLRPAQASKQMNGPQLAGFAAKTTAAADDVGLSPCR